VLLKKYLDAHGMIVSIGSACATADAKASHVLYAIRAPEVIRRGVLRISLGDDNTEAEARRFAACLISGVKKQMTIGQAARPGGPAPAKP
jgi:cysteine desulfurase